MKQSKKRYTKKHVRQAAARTMFLFILVVAFGYGIINSDSLPTKINELSASYISLNNPETTDILKVTNLYKQSDKKGMSNRNRSKKTFKMIGQRDSEYKIVVYHLGEMIDEKYVKFYLVNEMGKEVEEVLENQSETDDDGRVLFVGNISEGQNWTLKMWVDNDYKESVRNVSYEIRIKQVRS